MYFYLFFYYYQQNANCITDGVFIEVAASLEDFESFLRERLLSKTSAQWSRLGLCIWAKSYFLSFVGRRNWSSFSLKAHFTSVHNKYLQRGDEIKAGRRSPSVLRTGKR